MNKVEKFKEIVNKLAETYEKKNEDYNDSFGELHKKFGSNLYVIHANEKLQRIEKILKGHKPNNESVKDSLIDLACYSIMELIELESTCDKCNCECNNVVENITEDRVPIQIGYAKNVKYPQSIKGTGIIKSVERKFDKVYNDYCFVVEYTDVILKDGMKTKDEVHFYPCEMEWEVDFNSML